MGHDRLAHMVSTCFLLRKHRIVFQNGCIILLSCQNYMRVLAAAHSGQHGIVGLFNFSSWWVFSGTAWYLFAFP